MKKQETQLDLVYKHLVQGLSITPLDALNLYGCFRLSAVIHKLRHKYGIPIQMEQPEAANGKPYAKYWIDKDYIKEHYTATTIQ